MITDNYIKMCEQAKEIQRAWKPKIGDWYESIDKEVECVSLMGESIIEHHSKYHIWLPTQEQLQDMIDSRPYNLFYIFRHWYESVANIYKRVTWNELWLAFVMKEKYNKVWNGKKWEKIREGGKS